MADYNLWADLFDTWQSLSDWIKALVIVTLPAFGLGVLWLVLRHRARLQREPAMSGHYQWMKEQPAEDTAGDSIDAETVDMLLLTSLMDLQARLEEAKQALQHPVLKDFQDKCEAILRSEMPENKEGENLGGSMKSGHALIPSLPPAARDNEEIRNQIHQIIVEKYRNNRPPEEALLRARQVLLDHDTERNAPAP
ncbi:protein kinase [Agrobacterium vitis]|uniref:protein kinase n=1 Tax=Agrobacterium vitis TaxID=373 RepID=UPI0018D217DC|nr:protein kinase [Agrobacterium vitis]